MSDDIGETILGAVRGACPSGLWSRAVKLVRDDCVTLDSRTAAEVTFRVRTTALKVAAAATLVITGDDDQPIDWDCDCGGRVMPCEHIAAAAIAFAQAAQDPASLKSREQRGGRVVYHFESDQTGLRLRRSLRDGSGTDVPLEATLSSLLTTPAAAATLNLQEPDLRADLLLDPRSRAALPSDKLQALLTILADARGVFLDGNPVTVAREPIQPRATLADRGETIVLTIERDPAVTRVVAAGIALLGNTLHPLADIDLTGAYLQSLPQERVFTPAGFGELRTRVLPDLLARMPVDVRSRRLPETTRTLRPRIALDVSHVDGGLSVLPTLVYGDPPCARIQDGRLVHLGGPVPVRDEAAEQRLRLRLREQLDLLPGRRTTYSGTDAARAASRLSAWSDALQGTAAGSIRARGTLHPRLSFATNPTAPAGATAAGPFADLGFDLTFELRTSLDGDGAADLARIPRFVDAATVLSAWREGIGLCPLGDGGFAPLPTDFLARFGQRIADLLEARTATGAIARHALPALAELCDDLEQPRPPALLTLAPLIDGFTAIPPAALPGDLTATLRPYQRHGVDWLVFLRETGLGGLLADDMGLGKTVQALCAIKGRTLIVSPTSVVPNWRREIEKFRPGLAVNVYQGGNRTLDLGVDVTLTSYAILRLDADTLAQAHWDCIVIDEAQAIKNPDSQTARAAFALDGGFRVALTGTPVENRLDELWSLCHFTNRGLLGGRTAFDLGYGKPIADGDPDARARLRRRTKPFVLRRLKRDVAPELPPRVESVLPVVLDDDERNLYDAVRAAGRKDVAALLADGGSVMAALEALLRLRQAACHPALVPGQQAATSSKVESLRAALETAVADGHKALVFSQWTGFLDLIEPHLAEIPFCRLDGATRDRAAVVERFQDPAGPPVMLISLKAGGTGLNLAAADHVFICDPWWNPAVEAQAADRAHRIGQDRPVMIYRLVAQDTVEEKILGLQEHKRALAEAALGGGAATGAGVAVDAGLSREDLLALLE